MYTTHQDILKEKNHYVEYVFDVDKDTAYIYISWKNITYYITCKENEVFSSYDEQFFKIPGYAVKSLVYSILNRICREYKYPIRWVIYKMGENHIKSMPFEILEYEEDLVLSDDLLDMTKEVLQTGLRPDHILEAKAFNLKDGMESVLNYNFNLEAVIQ